MTPQTPSLADAPRDPVRLDEPNAALLRRYLRAVLGDQVTGDRLAAALWPGVAASVPSGDHADAADVLLGAMRRWRRLHGAGERAASFSHGAIAQAVDPADAPARKVGILVDVFSLSVAQAARALDRSEGEVTMLLAEARREAAAPIGGDVLVVEDEALVGQHLARLARDAGADTVTLVRGAAEAFEAAAQTPPRIVLCDYDLGDGPDGTVVIRRMMAEHDSVCLFVTAYPARASSGTDGEPAFIISKPFSEAVVRAALAYAGTADRPAFLAA